MGNVSNSGITLNDANKLLLDYFNNFENHRVLANVSIKTSPVTSLEISEFNKTGGYRKIKYSYYLDDTFYSHNGYVFFWLSSDGVYSICIESYLYHIPAIGTSNIFGVNRVYIDTSSYDKFDEDCFQKEVQAIIKKA